MNSIQDIIIGLRERTWLSSVSAEEMNRRDRWLADAIDAATHEWTNQVGAVVKKYAYHFPNDDITNKLLADLAALPTAPPQEQEPAKCNCLAAITGVHAVSCERSKAPIEDDATILGIRANYQRTPMRLIDIAELKGYITYLLAELDRRAASPPPAQAPWRCKAKNTADPPQDCDWPFCGCDPYADKVIAAIEESGRFAAAPAQEQEP